MTARTPEEIARELHDKSETVCELCTISHFTGQPCPEITRIATALREAKQRGWKAGMEKAVELGWRHMAEAKTAANYDMVTKEGVAVGVLSVIEAAAERGER